MEAQIISTDPGTVRVVGGTVRQLDLPPGVKVGDTVILAGRTARRKETCAMAVKETK